MINRSVKPFLPEPYCSDDNAHEGSSLKSYPSAPTKSKRSRLKFTIFWLVLAASTILICLITYLAIPSRHVYVHQQLRPSPLPRVTLLTTDKSVPEGCQDQSAVTFVREYFQSESSLRNDELREALLQTIRQNTCEKFVLVVSNPDYLDDIAKIQAETNADIDVFWSPVEVTYDSLLRAIKLSDPAGVFVLSTADVLIPSILPLLRICPGVFRDTADLFTISRRDFDQANCMTYRDWSSWDVFIGNATLITDYVLDNTKFSPTYWGVENILVYVLLHGRKPYNLCPHVDVVHYHQHRDERSQGQNRIRISNEVNSVGGHQEDLSQVCDMDAMKTQFWPPGNLT